VNRGGVIGVIVVDGTRVFWLVVVVDRQWRWNGLDGYGWFIGV
jgi:hypothetical protein